MSKDQPVYTTGVGRIKQGKNTGNNTGKKPGKSQTSAAKGPARVRRETKGRGGKTATIFFNLSFSSEEAKSLMRELQARFACGASFKDGTIILQGDFLEPSLAFFAEKGLKLVHSGG